MTAQEGVAAGGGYGRVAAVLLGCGRRLWRTGLCAGVEAEALEPAMAEVSR